MLRRILAVLGGFVSWTIVFLLAGQIARAVAPGAFEEDGSTRDAGVLIGLLGATGVCSLVGGLVVALIVRRRQLGTALVLGLVLLAVGIAVQVQYWDSMPLWYHLVFLGLLVPFTLAGHAACPARATR